LPDKAFRYAAEAGDLARRMYAHAEALASYDLALSLAQELDPGASTDRLRRVYSNRGSILEVTGRPREAEENYRAMGREAARVKDAAMQAEALNRLATILAVSLSRPDEARGLLGRALELAEGTNDLGMVARTLWNQGLTNRFLDPETATGDFLRALDIVRQPESQALPPEAGVRELEGFILADLLVTHEVCGRLRAATSYGRQALPIFRSLDNKAMVADVLGGMAMLSQISGDPQEALRLSQEGEEISTSIGNPWGMVYNSWLQLDVALDRGQWDDVRAKGEGLLGLAHEVSFPVFIGAIESILTRVYRLAGQPERAMEHAQAGLGTLNSALRPVWSIWAFGNLGLAYLAVGRIEKAAEVLEPIFTIREGLVPGFQGYSVAAPAILEYSLARGHFERGLAFADWLISRMDEESYTRVAAEVRHWRGRLHLAEGSAEQALADLDQARDAIRSIGIPMLDWINEAFRADALLLAGRPAEAQAARQQARILADELIAGLHSPDLHDGFAKTVAGVLEPEAA
jgi:tetratricopeptide (TPR) repeat protein